MQKTVSCLMLFLLVIGSIAFSAKAQHVEANEIIQNHPVNHPHNSLLPLSPNSSSMSFLSPPPVYDEQLGLTFTQNFASMAYNVTAVAQSDTYGYGPAYLLNGLSDSGYWYQVGLSYNWPGTGYSTDFNFIYAVFDTNGDVVFPSNGEFTSSFAGPVNSHDTLLLSLYFNSGNVSMKAMDWNTGAFAYRTYGDEGATHFVGQPSSSGNRNGFFSGLMTEWWHADPYYRNEEAVAYSNCGFALTSAWMWIAESSNNQTLFFPMEYVNYINPNQLQSLSSHNTTEFSDAYKFVTGCISGDLNDDLKVTLADLYTLGQAYGSKPGDPKWNQNADIDGNGAVGLRDLYILVRHYGQHCP